MQSELRLIGEIDGEIRELPWQHVAMCDTEQAAARLCVNQARVYRSQENLADLMEMSVGAFNTILNSDRTNRVRYFGRKREKILQRLCGNSAIDQWAELFEKGMLNCQKSKADREAELLRALAEIRASA